MAVFAVSLAPQVRAAVVLEDPAYSLKRTWSGPVELGVPFYLGGLMFSADGATLYLIGESESSNSAAYALPVSRDATTREVTGFGSPSVAFHGDPGVPGGLDAGFESGPSGTLFNTYYYGNVLAQRPGGVSGAEHLFDLSASGIPQSVGGLTFSPWRTDPGTGFGMMQVSVYGGGFELYDVPLLPLGGGVYEPQQASAVATLTSGAGAIHYIPSGPLKGDLMWLDWNAGEIRVVDMDPSTGHAVSASDPGGLFASGLGVGPWGMEFDPITNDLFVTTFGGDPIDSVIQIGGFPRTRRTPGKGPNGEGPPGPDGNGPPGPDGNGPPGQLKDKKK